MKLKSYRFTSLIKKVNNQCFVFSFIFITLLFSDDLDLNIEYEGNQYSVNNYIEQSSKIYYNDSGATTNHIFNTPFPPTNDPQLWINISGDFDSYNEYANIYIEEDLIGVVGNFYDQYSCDFWDGYDINRDEFNNYIDDGHVEISISNSNSVDTNVCGQDYHKIFLYYDQDPNLDIGEIEIGTNALFDLNINIATFYDEYGNLEDNDETRVVFVDVYGDTSFSCDNSTCGEYFITQTYPHTVNISYTPTEEASSEATLFVYDYQQSEIYEVKLYASGIYSSFVGDLNADDELSIYDILILLNLIFESDYNYIGDLNSDDILNIADVIILVDLILNN